MAGGINLEPGQYTIKQAAGLTGYSQRQLRYLDESGGFPTKKTIRRTAEYRVYTDQDIKLLAVMRMVDKDKAVLAVAKEILNQQDEKKGWPSVPVTAPTKDKLKELFDRCTTEQQIPDGFFVTTKEDATP